MAAQIHPTALVADGAELGDDVVIGPYSVIDENVKIGRGSIIEAFVRISNYVEIGESCHIYENNVLGRDPQDHDFGGEVSWVRIGNEVVCREAVTIHRASGAGNVTSVGDGTLLMESVHLGHNVQVGAHCVLTNKVGLSGYSSVGDYSVIGGLTGLHQFVKVGRYAMVGGLAKIIKDVPPFCLVDGHPARVYGLNKVGLRRNGFDQKTRLHIRHIYEALYTEHLLLREALVNIEKRWPNDPFATEIVAFVRSLKRGLTPWARGVHMHKTDIDGEER